MINKRSQMLENNKVADTKEKDISKRDALTVESRIMDTSVLGRPWVTQA